MLLQRESKAQVPDLGMSSMKALIYLGRRRSSKSAQNRQSRRLRIITETIQYPRNRANHALADFRASGFEGAAVLVP